MNLMAAVRGLLRRWYIVVPGVFIAVGASVGAWIAVPPGYERAATQLLLPGSENIPENGNPYLYLGGLTQAADVLVTAMSADNQVAAIVDNRPDVELLISRDGATSGPQLLITVTARTDADAAAVLDAAVARTAVVLEDLQDIEGIDDGNRIGIQTITQDEEGTPQQRTRILVTAATGVVLVVVAVFLAALIDGMSTRNRRGRRSRGRSAEAEDDDEVDVLVDDPIGDAADDSDSGLMASTPSSR